MRPKLLEIEGLQSFQRSQKIDFDTLGETGLFGIFGPTGSGKSTVLDAITLALYGKVKRAERGTQGIINTNMDKAGVAFTFALKQGSSKKTYRVERNFQRKKGTENACEPKVVRLIEITEAGEIPLCDKTTEVTNNIEALLGLNHDDFTRAVVLPQNSFQEFLFLDNSKKRQMLERIFYLEEYGKQLLDKVSRKMAQLKSRLDVLSGELLGYADATDEALEQVQMEMKDAVTERNRVETEFINLEKQYIEAKEIWQYVQELSFLHEKEEQHAAEKDAINEKRLMLEKAVKADSLLDKLRKNTELERKLQDTRTQLDNVCQSIPGIESDLHKTRESYEKTKSEAAVEQPRLVSLRTRLTDAQEIEAGIDVLNEKLLVLQQHRVNLTQEITVKKVQFDSEKEQLELINQSIDQLQKELADIQVLPEYREQVQEGVKLENQVEAHRSNRLELEEKILLEDKVIAGLNEKLSQTRENIASHQKFLSTLTAEKQEQGFQMPDDKNALMAYRDQINNVKNALDILNIRKSELDKAEKAVIGFDTVLGNMAENAKAMEAVQEERKAVYDKSVLEVEKAVSALEKYTAYNLSKTLSEGDPCPVCGSTNHPSPAAQTGSVNMEQIEKQVKEAQKRLAKHEAAFREAEKNALIANEQVKACSLQKAQAQSEREAKINQYKAEREKLAGPFRNMEPEQIQQELEHMNVLYREKLGAIEAWEKKQDEIEANIKKVTDQMNREMLTENGFVTELNISRESLNQLTQALETVKREQRFKLEEYQQFLEKHRIEGAAAELKKLSDHDKKSGLLQKKLEQSKTLSEKKRVELEELKDGMQQLKDTLVKVQAEEEGLNAQKADKEAKVKELAGDTGIDEQIRQIDVKLTQYNQLEAQFANLLQGLEKQYNELVTKRSTLQNQMDIFSDNLQQEEKALAADLHEKGFKTREEVEQAFIPQENLKTLKDEVSTYDQKTINLKAEKEIIEKKLRSRTITKAEWEALDCRYQEVMAWREACVTRSELTKASYENIKTKHDRWAELTKNYTELSVEYGLVQQVQKLLKAERSKDNSFIDYIAEERLRYIAAKASEILGIMTKFKYALELDTNAGFIIRDNANGGAHRMVTSLSGGETFLTALALALALSEQIQLKGQSPLEFFFLDEGFGTLDNNLLDTVIDCLERLSKKERVIGIISHVPELRNRINRRLVVTPPSSRGEGSQVKVEKA